MKRSRNGRERIPVWFVTVMALLVVLVFVGRALLVADAWPGGWTWVFATVFPAAVVLTVVIVVLSRARRGR